MHEARLVDEAERKAKEDRCDLKMVCLGKAMENYGNTYGKQWKTMGKLWRYEKRLKKTMEHYGKNLRNTLGKPMENYGKLWEHLWKTMGQLMENYGNMKNY